MPILSLKEILDLMDRVAEKGLGMVEIESAGMRVKIEGRRPDTVTTYMQPQQQAPSPESRVRSQSPAGPGTPDPGLGTDIPENEDSWHIITSPIVGTFYRSPNPESDAFVEVGDRVTKGKVICIIEAMKLMNEIEADADGQVVKIYPKNGQPIEYGEKLFALKPA